MYKEIKVKDELIGIQRILDNAGIPIDPSNSDYQRFKTNILEGAELQDADGNVMSPEAAQAFIATLP